MSIISKTSSVINFELSVRKVLSNLRFEKHQCGKFGFNKTAGQQPLILFGCTTPLIIKINKYLFKIPI